MEQLIKCGVWFSTPEQVKKKKTHLSDVAWVINGKDWIHIILTCYETGQIWIWRD